jgi:hypothetical protein
VIRRDFLKLFGLAAAAAVVTPQVVAETFAEVEPATAAAALSRNKDFWLFIDGIDVSDWVSQVDVAMEQDYVEYDTSAGRSTGAPAASNGPAWTSTSSAKIRAFCLPIGSFTTIRSTSSSGTARAGSS